MVARPRRAFDHAAAAGLLPRRATDRCAAWRSPSPRPVPARRERSPSRKSAPRAQQPLQLPALLQFVDPPERGDHLLAHHRALAPALDDLQIGAAGGSLLAEIRGGNPAPTQSRCAQYRCEPHRNQRQSAQNVALQHLVRPIARNHINALRQNRMRQLSKISLTAPFETGSEENPGAVDTAEASLCGTRALSPAYVSGRSEPSPAKG
jgi:hypothetical protein